jgi:hypothetical protein
LRPDISHARLWSIQRRTSGWFGAAAWEVGGRPRLGDIACIPQRCHGGRAAWASVAAQPVAGSGLCHVCNHGHCFAICAPDQGRVPWREICTHTGMSTCGGARAHAEGLRSTRVGLLRIYFSQTARNAPAQGLAVRLRMQDSALPAPALVAVTAAVIGAGGVSHICTVSSMHAQQLGAWVKGTGGAPRHVTPRGDLLIVNSDMLLWKQHSTSPSPSDQRARRCLLHALTRRQETTSTSMRQGGVHHHQLLAHLHSLRWLHEHFSDRKERTCARPCG